MSTASHPSGQFTLQTREHQTPQMCLLHIDVYLIIIYGDTVLDTI